MLRNRILLVEDDSNLGFLLQKYLEKDKFRITLARNGEEGYNLFMEKEFDLCILDVMMPKMDGFELASKVKRADKKMPIIFLTAKDLKEDKINGFRLGADDYITKPFDQEELLYRVYAVLNRTSFKNMPATEENIRAIGKYSFDAGRQLLSLNGAENRLTEKENEVLNYLVLHKGKVARREDILKQIWGENDYFHGRSLDVFIAKLRSYLKEDGNVEIETVYGVGFSLRIK